MPNIKSAKKRLRNSEKAAVLNVGVKTYVKTRRSHFLDMLEAGDTGNATTAYQSYCSALDKAAKKGVIKKNTAIRRKTRAAQKVRALA